MSQDKEEQQIHDPMKAVVKTGLRNASIEQLKEELNNRTRGGKDE